MKFADEASVLQYVKDKNLKWVIFENQIYDVE
jgi:hypothetical protein